MPSSLLEGGTFPERSKLLTAVVDDWLLVRGLIVVVRSRAVAWSSYMVARALRVSSDCLWNMTTCDQSVLPDTKCRVHFAEKRCSAMACVIAY
jgi:hypothetical protein